jgi:V8-like Glu-specific endopeptidase
MLTMIAPSMLFGLLVQVLPQGAHEPLQPEPEPIAPISFPEHLVPLDLDSGQRAATPGAGDMQLVYSTVVRAPDAPYVRVVFEELSLPGTPGTPDAAFVQITSLHDQAVQQLDARTGAQWGNRSAYFNGDAVSVELFVSPETPPARVRIGGLIAGEWLAPERSICGTVDDRTLSADPRVGRLMPAACSAWLFNERDNCLLTAGHCSLSGSQVVQFNVPLSDAAGNPVAPPPQDQYPVDPNSIQTTGNAGVGRDWATFGVFNNADTGLSPLEAQGASFQLAASAPEVSGQVIRVTGFGSTSAPVPRTWNAAQKTHSGLYESVSPTTIKYIVDTTSGNSGSPVIDLSTGLAIGIHTHGGCNTGGNQGTAIHLPALQDALNNPLGVCIPPSLTFSYPFGRPVAVSPDGGDTLRVAIGADSGIQLQPNTARLHVQDASGEQIVLMTKIAASTYEGVFPPVSCGAAIQYFVTAQDTEGTIYFDPRAAPGDPYTALVGHKIEFAANLNFESAPGWTVENSQLLTSGQWELGVPVVGAEGAPQQDHDLSGQCWLTENALTESDVDWGPTRLLSPVYDLSEMYAPLISYARWLSNNSGDDDQLVVELSDDGGDSWVLLEAVEASDDGWIVNEAIIGDYVDVNESFRVRFSVSDNPNNSVLEAGIDSFQIFEAVCSFPCTEGDLAEPFGVLDISDVLAFLSAFGVQDPAADLAPNFGEFDVNDILAFLTSFASGCP